MNTLAPRARVAEGVAPTLLDRLRVLHAEGEDLYASHGLELFRSRGGGPFSPLAGAPGGWTARALAEAPLSARFLRAGFHAVAPLPSGDLVAVVRGALLYCARGEGRFEVAHQVRRGTRPLGVAVAKSGHAYFGEYFGNAAREEVHVYGSPDGRAWEVAHTFPRGAVRHVHGVHADPHRGGLWVLTGDDGDEVGLWWTADEFKTLEPVVRGDQRARAVTVLPLEDGVVVPMDTPFEENHIQHLDPSTGRLSSLARLPGSVFCSTRTSRGLALSTVVEKSSVNTDPRVALFVSRDGHDWRPAARLERDLAWLRDRRGYLQYPTLRLPTGRSSAPDLLATAQSLAGCHGRLLRWSWSELESLIPATAELRTA